jgi:hypothetical protein
MWEATSTHRYDSTMTNRLDRPRLEPSYLQSKLQISYSHIISSFKQQKERDSMSSDRLLSNFFFSFFRRLLVGAILFCVTIQMSSATWYVTYQYEGSDCSNSTQFVQATAVVSGYCRDTGLSYQKAICDASTSQVIDYSRTAQQCGASPVNVANPTLNTCTTSSITQISKCVDNPLPFSGREFVLLLIFPVARNCSPNSLETASRVLAYASGSVSGQLAHTTSDIDAKTEFRTWCRVAHLLPVLAQKQLFVRLFARSIIYFSH